MHTYIYLYAKCSNLLTPVKNLVMYIVTNRNKIQPWKVQNDSKKDDVKKHTIYKKFISYFYEMLIYIRC